MANNAQRRSGASGPRRSALATVPVVENEASIAEAIGQASVLALVASTVHLTGDPSILRGAVRPDRFAPPDFDGGLNAEDQGALRRAALAAVVAYRDAGSAAPAPLSDAVVRELMDWITGARVEDDYAEMFVEEMDLAGTDPRRLTPAEDSTDLSVLVIGCGMSGLLAAIRLAQAGIPFEVIEKNADMGGTWQENTYPGCRVDVPSHYYCYSFEPNPDFSEHYSRQPELHTYFRDAMVRHDVESHVRWATEVVRAAWDDAAQLWQVTTRQPDGSLRVQTASAVISAVGQLNRPFIPDLPNLEQFEGPIFHSARWDHEVDLRGKRVALIGAGASGFQIGPAIAEQVERLVVFQRTAQWMMPNSLYRVPIAEGARWAMRYVPGYLQWYRFLLCWQATDKMLEIARVDPEWSGLPLSSNRRNARFREQLVGWIEDQLGDDNELVTKVVPDYPPLGKRLLQDDGSWLRCLQRDNVDLVRNQIADIGERAVITDGGRWEVDVIVLATGFRANDFLYPMEILGRAGATLQEVWDGRPSAYLGVTVPEFPNLFLMYGPGTNLAHAGSVIFQAECQMRYIGGCLGTLAANGGGSIEPTAAASNDYFDRMQQQLSTTVWAHPSVRHSWYKAADGRVYVLSPWRLVDYWKMTATPQAPDHIVRKPPVET